MKTPFYFGMTVDDVALRDWSTPEHLESLLEPYKIPRYIERLEEIPRTYNGKIDRKALLQKP